MHVKKKIVKNAIIYSLFILVSICIAYRMFVAYEMHCTPDRALSNISQGDIIFQYNYQQYVIVFTCDTMGNTFCHILKRTSMSNLVWYTIVKSEGPHKPQFNSIDDAFDEQSPVDITITLFPAIDDYLSTQPLYMYYGEIVDESVESFAINGVPCALVTPAWPESFAKKFPLSAKTKLFVLISPDVSPAWPISYSINGNLVKIS